MLEICVFSTIYCANSKKPSNNIRWYVFIYKKKLSEIRVMEKGKKHLSEFMETNKKRWHDRNFRHPWITGLYGSIFLVCILVLYGIFAKANIFQGTEANSARYMLSALIQSQAAIVAIVLIVTQIAIQLTPSYSPRVKIDLFRNNHAMWILLILYGISIFYSLIVLRLIKGQDGEVVGQSVIWKTARRQSVIGNPDFI